MPVIIDFIYKAADIKLNPTVVNKIIQEFLRNSVALLVDITRYFK